MKLYTRAQARPELALLNVLRAQPPDVQQDTIDHLRRQSVESHLIPSVRCNWLKEQADALRARGEYDAAIAKYKEAAKEIIGPDVTMLEVEYINPKYLSLTVEANWQGHLDVVGCCDGIAACYVALGKTLEALDWLQEVEVLYNCQRLGSRPTDLPFINCHLPVEDHWLYRISAANRYQEILFKLGNTASANFFAHRTITNGNGGGLVSGNVAIDHARSQSNAAEVFRLRHPEPTFVDRFKATDPVLQIRGAWTKLRTGGSAAPCSRLAFSSWIWKSKLYVCGGQNRSLSVHKDVWCLDLTTRDKWRRLQDHPEAGQLLYQTLKVYKDTAWMFQGEKTVWAFDLVREQWKKVETSFSGKWPYFHPLSEHCVEIFEDVMYVFGGDDSRTDLGVNIFMALDLKTLKWTHLGGTSHAVTTNDMPMLRRHASSWIVPEQKRLYIMYGNICRVAAQLKGKPHGNEEDYNHEDLWSYSISEKKWRRERLRGSFPSPRTEMASVYHGGLGAAIVFGGYNASTTSLINGKIYAFAFYGDTFMFDPETRIWKHVVTRGFPGYRAQSRMMVDEATGRTYLFGGYTNSDFVPSKHEAQRTFGDLWQLSIDTPGGHLEDADLEKDARAPKMGPWKRCFTCGSVGDTWKKCGGSCKGAYFFCSNDCLKEGWKEHKQTHGCRKV
ncbi:hypothetical protein PLICRDRAFT_161680 [Plicaturopsis crispa FD-325 SS-3]|nr:hypothetical protein PLICRDRAFT_161680 [Plicaturopsis crispa FD-325 SS-3]